MSLTNQQRTQLISAINSEDVRIITMNNGLLDALDLKRFLPSAVNDLLHKHVATFFLFRPHDDSKCRDSLTAWTKGGSEKIYAIGISDTAVNRGPYYLVYLLALELARIVCAEHKAEREDRKAILRDYLNYLIMLINQHTGKDIEDNSNYNPPNP